MNVARICKYVPSSLPHEYLGYHKLSLDGMLLSIMLLGKVAEEEHAQVESAKVGNKSGALSRIAKHLRNR